MNPEHLQSIVQALLFTAERPMTLKKLETLIESVSMQELRDAIDKIKKSFESTTNGIYLESVAGGYQFRTKLDMAPWVKKLLAERPMRMTKSQLETLSMVAYKQPITRIEVDAIRGVDSSYLLKALVDKKLIKILGVKEVPGRPLLYGTTQEFLEFFNLNDLSNMPSLEQLKELRGNEKSEMPLFAKDTLHTEELLEEKPSIPEA